jgi:TIR domain
MPELSINKRPYRTFLSHAHVDKGFVDKLHLWLSDFAGLRVWYDSVEFPSGLVASELGKAIENCQSAILVLSNDSVQSGWVEEEWNICVAQKNTTPDFQILMLNLDKCVPPAPLRVRKWIDVHDGSIAPQVACQLLEGLHWHSTRPSELGRSTFYLSRGSKPIEVEISEKLLSRCRNAGCRFVRDSPDQFRFHEERIKDIIASTSGLFAFVPNRGEGGTSKYILDEIRFAKEMNVSALIVLDAGISKTIVEEIAPKDNIIVEANSDVNTIEDQVYDFIGRARAPLRGAHCFLGHALDQEQSELWSMARRVAEAVSGLPCYSGDELTGDGAQREIVEKIRTSAVSIFDISNDRLNTCIEAGIARGAGARYELVCHAPRRHPPFIFRDKQVRFYETPAELLGLVRKLVFDFRRVVS